MKNNSSANIDAANEICDPIRAYASVITHDQPSPSRCTNTGTRFYKTMCNIADSLSSEGLELLSLTYDSGVVHIDLSHKFSYMGDKESMDQVITNILQNAFYQIRKAKKGEIFISTEASNGVNILRIKDTTGGGVSSQVVKNMFNTSYTSKPDEDEIGLNFCKRTMQRFGGDILIGHSDFTKSIEFILQFPQIRDKIS